MSNGWPITLSVVTISPPRCKSLAPAPGVTPAPEEASPHRFLSDELIARQVVAPDAMRIALQASLAGRSLTEILVSNGDLSEDDLARTLATHHGLDHVDLEQFLVDYEAAALIEPDVARRLGAVAIAFLPSGAVVVALYEPNGSTAVLELARLTGRTIQPAVSARSQIEALIESLRRRVMARPAASEPDVAPAEPHLRPLASGNIVVSRSGQAGEPRRSIVPAAVGAARQPLADGEVEGQLGAARQRAEVAERRRRAAEDRARAAQEQARSADARARLAEARAAAAAQLVDAAEARAGDATAAIEAANTALERLLRACEILERHVETGGPEIESSRTELEVERDRRARVEEQLRAPLQPLAAGTPDAPAAARADAAGATGAGSTALDVAAEVTGEHPQAVATQAPDGSGADVETVVPAGSGADVAAAAGDAPVPDVPDASEGASGAEGDPAGPGRSDEPAGLGGRRRLFGGRRRG